MSGNPGIVEQARATASTLASMPAAVALSLLFALALAASLAVKLWLVSRQMRHVAAHRAQVPAPFEAAVSLAAHQKAADYTIAKARLSLLSIAWNGAVLLGWTLLGGLDALNGLLHDHVLQAGGPMAY